MYLVAISLNDCNIFPNKCHPRILRDLDNIPVAAFNILPVMKTIFLQRVTDYVKFGHDGEHNCPKGRGH